MIDIVDKTTRSRMMSGIRGKNTRPEMLLRRALHQRGFRFRVHGAQLPGKPDICLRKHNAVIFVHGCFWHRHEGCRFSTVPATRQEFWLAKFAGNVERDARNIAALRSIGWRVAVVWECALKGASSSCCIDEIAQWLWSDESHLNQEGRSCN